MIFIDEFLHQTILSIVLLHELNTRDAFYNKPRSVSWAQHRIYLWRTNVQNDREKLAPVLTRSCLRSNVRFS